ncbi:GNAT family N-acetyltransferase (plasmid) [Aminobacter sp. SR38]|jgi:acyl-homoserine lactone synthase|uniref:acyl-homoserine-lactone synthase n=1 Tax=Aminobacter sp. SR38 TaxID=2774562 RepID=UPI00177D5A43|nr:acyl-homoserine-lactone synthase [Aminobacter sp. SR38]QOF75039.1 GNAT family N-acetyltransferase [Aminobacter sp. SR38]
MGRIVIVDWSNKALFQEQLERHFQLRHEIYVIERKWQALARPIDIEMDAFDTEHAIYLLALDSAGDVIGGSRLVPTTQPHLLGDVFPQLANGSAPRAPDIYEWTRFFIAFPHRTTGKSARPAGEVLCGLLEVSLRLGIRKISVVCEAFWPDRLRTLGWKVEVLGERLQREDCEIVGALIEVSQAALESTKRFYDIEGSVLHPPDTLPPVRATEVVGP